MIFGRKICPLAKRVESEGWDESLPNMINILWRNFGTQRSAEGTIDNVPAGSD